MNYQALVNELFVLEQKLEDGVTPGTEQAMRERILEIEKDLEKFASNTKKVLTSKTSNVN